MQRFVMPRFCRTGFLALLLVFLVDPAASAAENAGAAEAATKPGAEQAPEAQQILRSYLQLQEQLHTALLAIERIREDADAAAERSTEAVTARLKLIEEAINVQRDREMDSVQSSNRFLLIVAGAFAGVGFVALLLTSLFQLRAMNRLAEIASSFPAGHGLGQTHPAVLGAPDSHPAGLNAPEQSSTRLLGVIERLEKRVLELEHTAHPSPTTIVSDHLNGAPVAVGTETHAEVMEAAHHNPDAEKRGRIELLLGKGQALLNLDQAENALDCFEEVFALDPENAEALVKKGTALERLKRLEEAIGCYDRAIAVNQSMTLAYLYKGGVYNQMERFNEALECYEQALRTQEKAPDRHPESIRALESATPV